MEITEIRYGAIEISHRDMDEDPGIQYEIVLDSRMNVLQFHGWESIQNPSYGEPGDHEYDDKSDFPYTIMGSIEEFFEELIAVYLSRDLVQRDLSPEGIETYAKYLYYHDGHKNIKWEALRGRNRNFLVEHARRILGIE